MTVEVDLLDQGGVIRSVGAVDEAFWASSAAWATGYAASFGVGVYVPGGAPDAGAAERNITVAGDWQNWIASMNVGTARSPTLPEGPAATASPSAVVLGGSAIGGMLGAMTLGPLGAAIGAVLGGLVGGQISRS